MARITLRGKILIDTGIPLMAFDPQGKVTARTDAESPFPVPNAQATWIQPALENRSATGILITSSGVYNAAIAPAEVSGGVFALFSPGLGLTQR